MRTQMIEKSVVVASMEGDILVVNADGSTRPLLGGETLPPGTQLTLSDDAKLVLITPEEAAALAQGSSVAPEADIPTDAATPDGTGTSLDPNDIAALQQSILEGVDPTQSFEAAAAGGAPAAGGGDIGGVAGASGNGGFVTISRTAGATIAQAGFDTSHDTQQTIDRIQEDLPDLDNELSDLDEQVSVAEDGQLNGNLLDNASNPDGPDAASVTLFSWGDNVNVTAGSTVTIPGVGTLTVNGNGDYSFTPALNYDGPVPPVNYSVTDGTDVVDSTLTITITPVDEGVSLTGLGLAGGELVVSDANLADGTNPNPAALTQGGVFSFSAPDGVQTLSIAGLALITNGTVTTLPQSITTPLGNNLQITAISFDPVTGAGSISYSYTLQDNESHVKPVNDTQLTESFQVTLTDQDGDTTSASLDAVILDDVPTAVNDSNLATASENNLVLNGNVISNDVQGADGAAVTAANLTGTYGSLVLNANGTYSYTLAPLDPQFVALPGGSTGSEVFTYTLTDADGDVSTATLTLSIRNDDDEVTITNLIPQGAGGDAIVYEDDLLADRGTGESAGSDNPKDATTVTGSFNISAPDGVQTLSVGGISLVSGGVAASLPQSVTTPLGNTLTITGYDAGTGLVSYSYSLLDNEAHPTADGNNSLFENFAVSLTDSDGDSASNTLSVQIVDDVPTAVNDSNPATASENNLVLNGNVISNDVQGADGAAVTAANLTGTYGSLVLNANGTYSYTLAPLDPQFVALPGGSTGSEVFTYTLTDADGDVSTATLTLAIKNDDDEVTITNLIPQGAGGDAIVYEDDLLADRGTGESAGSDNPKDATTVTGSFNISAPDGVQTLSVGGISLVSGGVVAS
ncbi:retention module-containing protein, partial [Aeromonas sobria]|uniref:retention module-containing protein n=1 Tax=Aeromonas sobria TaxID=646 RepID=UPI003CFC85D0